ncbi:lamin tail domain-containing protein [Streptomyces cyaneus]|uniref:lamin tail domain-containing protein n=1 Tax=Streptomyces cyaneus TaxID=1904 RepID=UPI001FEBE2DA|nr:lamin tail domain-containing protein [Streptomyces cyaneus]
MTLLNASPDPVDLTGWHLQDRLGKRSAVPPRLLPAGACLIVRLGGGAQLGNHGGEISLLDAEHLKVDGVSYTAEQAGREGWSVVF